MGKNKGGKKSSAAAAKAPKCTCEDPYRCTCGNRPERPSRGHKWDPVAQQWAGKGHKQKGASGQVSSVGTAAKTTTVGKTQIAQWQKLPSKILDAFCRKEKRPNPKYKSLDRCKQGCFKYRVIIQDAKSSKRGGDNDLFFVPTAEVPNEEQAREEAALLALLHLTPTLPHERTLPEPYKTTWLNALANKKEESSVEKNKSKNNNSLQNINDDVDLDKKPTAKPTAASSSKLAQANTFTSLAQKRQQINAKKKERNTRIRKHEAFRLANRDAQVFMSAQIRQQIESFLRGDVDEALLKALAQSEDEKNDDDEESDDFLKSYVVSRLSSEGFSKSQARTSFSAITENPPSSLQRNPVDEDGYVDSLYEECLQWLCVHLDEHQLPEGFDPRGRTLDVVMPSKRNNKDDQIKPLDGAEEMSLSNDIIEFSQRLGLTIQEASLLSDSSKNCPYIDSLLEALVATIGQSMDIYSQDKDLLPATIEINNQLANDEIEVLQSMFIMNEDLYMNRNGNHIEVKIEIPNLLDESDSRKKTLNIMYNMGSYPRTVPKAFVTGSWEEGGSGTVFHVKLTEFLFNLPRDEPMIFEIFGYVQELLGESESSLREQRTEETLIPFLKGGKKWLESKDMKSAPLQKNTKIKSTLPKARNNIHRRPRERSFFWSKKPYQTPVATAFPKLSTFMETSRKRLPAAKARSEFLSVLKMSEEQNNVVLVTGETGCGKTTQIPQFILEEAPDSAKIVVAQPRRLAATGVADRVAKERGEEKAGVGSVGYVVRGDVAMCNDTRLMFCTTGVLLRQLQSEGALECISHIVIDEVHERHLDTDVLLGILKQSKPLHLKVVLMSATMDADRFAAFWGPKTPRMHIPGFTHPVADFTLEHVLMMTGYVPPKKKKKTNRFGKKEYSKKHSPWADSEKSDEEEENCNIVETTKSVRGSNPKPLPMPVEELVKRVGNEIDYDLIAILVRHLVESKEEDDNGSILVFLPGAPEINRTQETIMKVTRGKGMKILPLHGGLQPREQQLVFKNAEKGITKVILSTNVAETSITIPDCTMVVDTCKEKQSSYDPSNRMPLLLETFASQDSLKQRRGRAGRVRPGSCYKLISQEKFAKLPLHGEPEIKRCALDQTLLSLLFLGIEKSAGTFLSKLLDPPSQISINAAVFSLEKLGAISSHENDLILTPLGMHLAAIPAPPSVGKMLVMGSLLGCRSASLALAAGMSVGRSPFLQIRSQHFNQSERDEKTEREEMKNEMILQERKKLFESVGNSDLALLAAVYMKWDALKGGGGAKRKFCESMGLAINGIRDMKQLVNQLDGSLSAAGFAPSMESDQNVNSWRIIRSCIVSSLAPAQIVRVQRPSQKYAETVEGAVQKEGDAKELKFFTRSESQDKKDIDSKHQINTKYHGIPEERVFIHPSSANFSVGDYSCPWIVYHNLVRTTKPFLRDANECNIYDLLLFGGSLEVSSAEGIIVIDDYVRLSANARIGALIRGLRTKVDDILSQKVANPSMDLAKSVEMKLIVKLLRTDGLGR